ncbi:hypothetical protein NGUA21_00353 [Salmonella enterica]|nr:hypothetical protein NGUA21_00353 [Salmonella enterica]
MAPVARFIVSPKPRYARRPATSFPLKFVSVLSSGCFPPRAFNIVVAKLGSLPNAVAISLMVSSVSGADPTNAEIARRTKAVVAICVLLVSSGAVGAEGVPVSDGLSNGAFNASSLLIVVLKFGSLLIASAIFFSVLSVSGDPPINPRITPCTNVVLAI